MSQWPELRVNVHRLLQRHRRQDPSSLPNDSDEILIDLTVPAEGIEITTARVPNGEDVVVAGRLVAGLTGVEARLDVRSRWQGECRRCVELVEGSLELSVHATYLIDAEGSDADADVYELDGEWADLGEPVREELMLALPLSPLCSLDCPGADPDRFPTAGQASGDSDDNGRDAEEAIDPRWAALSQLTFDVEE